MKADHSLRGLNADHSFWGQRAAHVAARRIAVPAHWVASSALLPTCSRSPDTKRSHAHHRHAGHPIVDDIKYGGRGGTLGSAAEEVAAARSVVELLPATPSFPAESYDALCEGRLGLGVA